MALEKATFAAGCFWCTEAVFKRLKGVQAVTPGYTGGHLKNPTYQDVVGKNSGHAEAIDIAFDPEVISYKVLLDIFFHMHDPTSKDRQGNDIGPQYRSAVFYHSQAQKTAAHKAADRLVTDRVYTRPAVTEIVPAGEFYPAEEHHRNYYEKNSYQPYCQYVIDPKITKLLKDFTDQVKEEFR